MLFVLMPAANLTSKIKQEKLQIIKSVRQGIPQGTLTYNSYSGGVGNAGVETRDKGIPKPKQSP